MHIALAALTVALSAGISQQKVCDPFGRVTVECTNSSGPIVSGGLSTPQWQLEGSGGVYQHDIHGSYATITLGANTLTIGAIRVGIDGQISAEHWEHSIFSDSQTTLGTSRDMKAGFVGAHVGVGDYDHAHAYLTLMPGYWQSSYNSTLTTPGHWGTQSLAFDRYALSKMSVSIRNIPLGKRIRVSADTHYLWAWPKISHDVFSSTIPHSQWFGTLTTEVHLRSFTPQNHIHLIGVLGLADHYFGVSKNPYTNLSLHWTFQ